MTDTPLPILRLGTGSPLVLIPGLSGRHGVPRRLWRWLQRKEIVDLSGDREVWSIDRRSGLEPGITVAELAIEYAETIRSLFAEPVDIVGVSTGGSIALQLAVDFPELIGRLVLVSAAYRLSDRGRLTQRNVATFLRSGGERRAAALLLSNTAASRPRRVLLAAIGILGARVVVGHHDDDLGVLLGTEDEFDLSARIGLIGVPTLVTGGARDRFYSAALFEETAARIPNAELIVYPRAGHIGTRGNRRLVRHILEFLQGASELKPSGRATS
jgi:pimeloyl-ACP methyl ester carboxylesterase